MPELKIQIPQAVYEQLLEVASCAWRPPIWQAEWLLRRAIQAEAAKRSQEFVPAELPAHQT